MKQGFDYYRIKMAWTWEDPDGSLAKVKTDDLVYASSYTEAEKVAYALIADQTREQYGDVSFEIIKTKITEMLFNNTLRQDSGLIEGCVYNFLDPNANDGTGIYSVKVMLISIDEKSGKEKHTYQTIYTPASSNTHAAEIIALHFGMADFVIRDIKFDKAESVLWPEEIFKLKIAPVA